MVAAKTSVGAALRLGGGAGGFETAGGAGDRLGTGGAGGLETAGGGIGESATPALGGGGGGGGRDGTFRLGGGGVSFPSDRLSPWLACGGTLLDGGAGGLEGEAEGGAGTDARGGSEGFFDVFALGG